VNLFWTFPIGYATVLHPTMKEEVIKLTALKLTIIALTAAGKDGEDVDI